MTPLTVALMLAAWLVLGGLCLWYFWFQMRLWSRIVAALELEGWQRWTMLRVALHGVRGCPQHAQPLVQNYRFAVWGPIAALIAVMIWVAGAGALLVSGLPIAVLWCFMRPLTLEPQQ